jgi:hypothetical protein
MSKLWTFPGVSQAKFFASLPSYFSASIEINGHGIRPVAFVVQPFPPFDDSEDIRESLADLPIRVFYLFIWRPILSRLSL